jgi:hypothetical protein
MKQKYTATQHFLYEVSSKLNRNVWITPEHYKIEGNLSIGFLYIGIADSNKLFVWLLPSDELLELLYEVLFECVPQQSDSAPFL